MRISYDKEHDRLYIRLRYHNCYDTDQVAPGITLDYGASGAIVGMEIEQASTRVHLDKISVGLVNRPGLMFDVKAAWKVNDAYAD